MKLNELKTKDLVKVLVYGEAGSGKTVFAAGFPGPTLYFDFDNKVSSAARFYSADNERLSQIEVINLAPQIAKNPIDSFLAEIDKLSKMQRSGEYAYKTVVIDSITTFSAAVLNSIVSTNPGIKRTMNKQGPQPGLQDYGILRREFQKLIPGLLSLDINVVMLGHIATDKDETTGEIVRGVLMDGSFSQQLPIYFDEVYRAYVEEKDGKRRFMAQTQSDARFKCRSQIPGLPATIELKYENLIKPRTPSA